MTAALTTTFRDAIGVLTEATRPASDQSYRDLRWALYLRMLGERSRVVQAAYGHGTWYDDFDESDFAAMDAALEGRLSSSFISTVERAECEAALTVIDIARGERAERGAAA